MSKVKMTFSLDERSAVILKQYADDLHVSRSALLSMFITNLDQGIRTVVNTLGTEVDKELLRQREGAEPLGDEE